jgi:uncharacterized protein YqgC (DUF456 family)
MNAFGEVVLFLGMLLGLAIIPLGLPGAALILVCILVYALATDFSAGIGIPFFIFLCGLTAIAETADNWLTALGARRYGASTTAMWLSLPGGLLGAIAIGSPLAFLFGPLGPVAGAILGAFASVVFYEYRRRKNWREALRAGWGTFLGRMAGIMLKLAIAVAMVAATVFAVL